MVNQIYGTKTAAEILSCSERWLKERLREGDWPGRKVTNRWSMSQQDIDEVIRLSASAREPGLNDFIPGAVTENLVVDHVAKILTEIPELTEEQRVRLAELLRGVQ
jgi:hypothetical protein